MKEEQFEAVVAIGANGSLALISCDSDFVLNDIMPTDLYGKVSINIDWQNAERSSIARDKDFGTYEVKGIVTISDDREQWDYTTTWEKIA